MASPSLARVGWLALALVFSVSHVASAAGSESDDLSKARAKFMRATELEQAGNYASALQALREVAQVRMTPNIRYHIALCEEKLGKLVAALGGYELALGEAESLGPEFHKEVEARANDLRSRIPKLVIERGTGAQAANIELDGVSLGASSIGVEVPLDPGPHDVTAKAPGYKIYTTTVEVAESKVERVSVKLDKLTPEEAAPRVQPNSGQPSVTEPTKPSRLIPYIIGGAGAAALLNSGVFYILQRNKDSELNSLCGGTDCTKLPSASRPHATALNDKLRTYSTVTQISLVAGIVALGTAATLILTEPKTAKPKSAWFFAPEAPGANLAGLSMRGQF